MKNLIILLFIAVLSLPAKGQNYTFKTSVQVEGDTALYIELTTNGVIAPYKCLWGYNFDISFDYDIHYQVSGEKVDYKGENNYTLQGDLICGGKNSFFNLPNSSGQGSGKTVGNIWNGNSDCKTATVVSLMCDEVDFLIEFEGYSSHITVMATPALPIELLSFNIAAEKYGSKLSWQTASETNNDYFEIERSFDGYKWKKVYTVQGQGNLYKKASYEQIDRLNYNGTVYYRLSQTDFDGGRKTFPPKTVVLNNKNTVVKVVNLLGREVRLSSSGIKVVLYSDGSIEKVI